MFLFSSLMRLECRLIIRTNQIQNILMIQDRGNVNFDSANEDYFILFYFEFEMYFKL